MWLFVHVQLVNCPTVKGVALCHRLDVNVVNFDLLVLNQSR